MNRKLLIVGAGGHGQVVAEVAQTCGYNKIAFIDDNNELAIGKIADLEMLKAEYDDAFVSIGNNLLRKELLQKLKQIGYTVPTLIHPTAYVSESAEIGYGTIVEPKAIVNANAVVREGCIISVGSIVDHNAEIGSYCHINAGAIAKAGATVTDSSKVDAGEIVSEF